MQPARIQHRLRGPAVRPTLAAALLCCLSGCATHGPLVQNPEVELRGVELQALSFTSQKFLLRFNVTNPNAFALPVRGIRYMVFLERERFAQGETTSRFSVPANGSGDFDISVELDLISSATSLAPLLRAGSSRPLEYELHGSLAIGIPLAGPLSFSRQGTIVVQ